MANEVTHKTGNALAGIAGLKGNLRKAKAQIPESINAQFLRFLQDGHWVFGQENEEVKTEDRVAVNPMSIKTGFSCWTDRPGKGAKNENMGEAMVPLGAEPLLKSDLPKHKDPQNGDALCEWKEQVSVDVKFLSGPHKGKQVHYKTTSVGGTSAIGALMDQIMIQLDEDENNPVPIVNFDGDHYNHKKYGRTYTPLIRIVGWTDMNAVGADAAPEAAPPKEVEDQRDEEPEDQDNVIDGKAEEVDQETDQEPDEQDDEPPRRRRRR